MISRLGSNAAKEEAEEEEKEEDNSAARGAARAANVRAAAAAENIDFILKDKCREMTRVIVALLDTPRHTLSRVSNTPYLYILYATLRAVEVESPPTLGLGNFQN